MLRSRLAGRIRSFLALPVAIAVVLTIAAIPAFGGRGGDPGPNEGPSHGKSPATITSDCGECPLGAVIHFSGAGFDIFNSQMRF